MYIKYREIEGELAILDAHSVQIMKDYDEGGFLLVPNWSEREPKILDAAVSRLAALFCGRRAVQEREADIRHNEADELFPVASQVCRPDPYLDCIAWYETVEEANAVMEKIAEAIARGERLYDLTQTEGFESGG